MQAVAKMPDYPIAEFQPFCLKNRIEQGVKRYNLSILDVVANLPAN